MRALSAGGGETLVEHQKVDTGTCRLEQIPSSKIVHNIC
jgi:hypothetical protein